MFALVPSVPSVAATIKGTVVHKNAGAQSFTVATPQGTLRAIHARRSPGIGRVVTVVARKLNNGTYGVKSVVARGKRTHARVRGTVTYANAGLGVYTVSARGVSLLIKQGRGSGRTAANTVPNPGTKVEVDVGLNDSGDLEEQDLQETGQDTNGISLEGTVLAVDPVARTLSISADDQEETGAALTVNVPAAFDISAYQVGQDVELTVTDNGDGTYTLSQSSGDDNQEEADDPSEDQGGNGDSNGGHGGDGSGGSDGGDALCHLRAVRDQAPLFGEVTRLQR